MSQQDDFRPLNMQFYHPSKCLGLFCLSRVQLRATVTMILRNDVHDKYFLLDIKRIGT